MFVTAVMLVRVSEYAELEVHLWMTWSDMMHACLPIKSLVCRVFFSIYLY